MTSTYADRIQGVQTSVALKAPCRVATTANITLSGLQTIDGVTVVADDRVLVKNQTTATENGIYVAASTAWTRAIDFNGARDVVEGTRVFVVEGTLNAGNEYSVTTGSPVIGTTSIAFGSTAAAETSYDSVSAVSLAADLIVGQVVRTSGYTTAGDHGGGNYEIVPAGTGTADGVFYIDLSASGFQAMLLHEGDVWGEQAGAVSGVEAAAKLQAAWNGLVAWKDAHADDPDITLRYRSVGTLQNQLKLRRSDGSRVLGGNIDFTGSTLTAVSGGDLSSTTHMILIRLKGVQRWGTIYGDQIAAGMNFNGMAGSRSYDPQVYGCVGRHITVQGASGSFFLYTPLYNQWFTTDVEYDTQANHTAIGIECLAGDWACLGAQGKWCGVPLVIGVDSVQTHFINCHFFSGNNNYPSSAAFVDPVAVENYATRQNHLINCYIDDGLIEDFTTTLNRVGCHLVDNALATLTHPIIRMYSDEADQGRAKEMVSVSDRGKFSIGYLNGVGTNWAGDISGLDALYTEMASRDRVLNTYAREYNIHFPNIDIIQYNYKPEGHFEYIWRIGTDEVSITYSPTGGHIITNGSDVSGSFGSRSALVTWIATYGDDVPDKAVVRAGHYAWRKITGSTNISDMLDFIPHGPVHANHFDPTETGIQEAAAYAASIGEALHLAGGDYAITQVDTTLFNVANLRIVGMGRDQTTLTISTAATNPDFCRAANVTIENIGIVIDRTSDGSYDIRNHNADGFTMRNVRVTGDVVHTSGSTYARSFNVVEFPNATDADNVLLEGCTFDTTSRIFLKANAATSTQTNIRMKDCDVYNAHTSCAGINSPNGVVDGFHVEDCRFWTHLGESLSDPGHYVGCAGGVRNFSFINLKFYGTTVKCIHLEEHCGPGIIDNPEVYVTFPNNANSAAIDFQPNDNSGSDGFPTDIIIKGGTLKSLAASQYGYGIRGVDTETAFARDSGRRFIVSDVSAENFNIGFSANCLTDNGMVAHHNTAIDCYMGFRGRNLAAQQFADNLSNGCDYGVVSDEGAVFVRHRFIGCTNLTGATSTSFLVLLDWTTEFANADYGAASTADLIVMDGMTSNARISGTLDTIIVSDDNLATYRTEREVVTWDGGSLSATGAVGAGANCTVALSVASDELVQTPSITSAETNVQVSCKFTGFAHLRPPVVA